MTPLLDVRDLEVGFNGRAVVHRISFAIAEGEKLALVGESGSGKTVSALSLLRLVQNARVGGSARLQGRDLLALSERELRGVRGDHVAVIFQEPMTALNPLYTVGEQIAEVLQLKRGLASEAARAAVLASLSSVDVVTVFEPGAAAALARAIRPDVLLCADACEAEGLSAPLAQEWGGEVKRLSAAVAVAE